MTAPTAKVIARKTLPMTAAVMAWMSNITAAIRWLSPARCRDDGVVMFGLFLAWVGVTVIALSRDFLP